MLSQLGCMSLPPDTLERLYYGRPLSEAEQEMVSRVPAITERLAQILGPDLNVWRTQMFHKPPKAPAIQFHQASTFMVEITKCRRCIRPTGTRFFS